MLYDILPPTGNIRGPSALDSLLRTFASELSPSETVSLQLRSDSGEAGLSINVPSAHRGWLWSELLDAYPGAKLIRRPDDSPSEFTTSVSLTLRPDLFPLRTINEFGDKLGRDRDDPIGGLLSRLKTGRDGRVSVCVSLAVTSLLPLSSRCLRVDKRN